MGQAWAVKNLVLQRVLFAQILFRERTRRPRAA